MTNRLPHFVDLETAARWLTEHTGKQWTPREILGIESGLRLHVWLNYDPRFPALFGNRVEGFMTQIVFVGDQQRLAFDGAEGVLSMGRTPSGRLFKIMPPAPIVATDLRIDRKSLQDCASAHRPRSPDERRRHWRELLREEIANGGQRGALNRAAKRAGVTRQSFVDAFGESATVAIILSDGK